MSTADLRYQEPRLCRAASRKTEEPWHAYTSLGFRLVRRVALAP